MQIQILKEIKTYDGLIEISIKVSNNSTRIYNYVLSSDFGYSQFLKYYKLKKYGKALSILNKFKEINYDYV